MSDSIWEEPGDSPSVASPATHESTSAEPDPASAGPGRSRKSWLVRGLATLLVITLVAAGAVIGDSRWRAHQREVARRHLLAQQQAYLDAVRRLDRTVAHDIAPIRVVLRSLTAPRPGDLVAARDAFANAGAESALQRDITDLGKMRVPTGWQRHQSAMLKSLKDMEQAVAQMRRDRNSDDLDFLNRDLQTTQGSAVVFASDDWWREMKALFQLRRQRPPEQVLDSDRSNPPPSLTSWVFGADRACIRGNIRVSALQRRGGRPDAAKLRQYAALLADLSAGVKRVPLPRALAGSLRRDVLSRMRSFDGIAQALRQEADAVDRLDIVAAENAVDRMKTLRGGLPLLERGFRKYHVFACGGSATSTHRAVAT